uniref:Uncharacterized protein n=1 Tax=Rhizophora mucronata TaxID=61149 RepID=A0A2P2NSW6_RHIMU
MGMNLLHMTITPGSKTRLQNKRESQVVRRKGSPI